MGGFAWVTLATNDSYSLGALVLAHSLRRSGTVHQLAILITPGVTPSMREKLAAVFNSVVEVNVLDSQDAANLALLARPDLGITFTKLHCWRLTQYDKCCFLDADTLVVQNVDELSEREELSAAPDVGWPDCFNSGVFVYKPSIDTFNSLMNFALQFGSFDGGDQGLLNQYFKDWAHKDISRHLPFIYNMSSTATYSYLPAFKQFGTQVKIIHFLGTSKPWLCYLDSESKVVQVPEEFNHVKGLLQYWWDIFCQNVHPSLTPSMHVDSSFFQAPHTHPAHHELSPSLPTHNIPSMMFIDPWDDYVERLQREMQQQKQKEGWLEIISQDKRQSGCDDKVAVSNTIVENNHESNLLSDTNDTQPSFNTNHDSRNSFLQEETSYTFSYDPHPDSPSWNSHTTQSSTSPLPNNSSGDLSVDGHTELNNSAGLAGALSHLTLGEPRSAEQTALEDQLRRQSWEQGHIDYMGRDSFENIWSKILKTLGGPAPTESDEPPLPATPASSPASVDATPAPSPAPVDVAPTPSPAPADAAPTPSPAPADAAPTPSPAPMPQTTPAPSPAPVAAPLPEVAPAPPAVPVVAPAPEVAPAAAPAPIAPSAPVVAPAPSLVPVVEPPNTPAAPTPAPVAVAAAPLPVPATTSEGSVMSTPESASAIAAPIVPAAAAPPTPTVTSASPPTSPPVAPPPQPQPSPEALKVDPTPPGTPPVTSTSQSSEPLDASASAPVPVPPKRKGSGSAKGKK